MTNTEFTDMILEANKFFTEEEMVRMLDAHPYTVRAWMTGTTPDNRVATQVAHTFKLATDKKKRENLAEHLLSLTEEVIRLREELYIVREQLANTTDA
jgi:hypothetical protein